jgi:ATP-dependent Clp endopeptidase proteolytic subunit ClpP
MSVKWFMLNASAGRISIHSDIGYGGINAAEFSAQLDTIRSSTIHISINSNGGDVATGFAIYNMLARKKAHKIVTIEGLAASMASVIAMAGDQIVMPSNAMMMIHNPWGSIAGGAEQIESFSEALRRMQANIVETYRKRTKLPADKIQAMMDAETWLTASEAVELGFADEVEGAMDMAANVRDMDLRAFKRVPDTFGRSRASAAAPRTIADISQAAWDNWNKMETDNQSVPRKEDTPT